MAARAGMRTPRNPQHDAQAFAVEHIVFRDIVIAHHMLFLSAISAIFASLRRVSPLTREYER